MANEDIFRHVESGNRTGVVLSAQEASEAARLIKLLLKRIDEPNSRLQEEVRSIDAILSSPSRIANRKTLIELARHTFMARRARSRFIGGAMFGEPAWDMLLALYVTESSSRQTITRLTELSGVPATTALRWIEHLISQGFARRRPHITDGRVTFIEISDKGRNSLDAYFSAMLEKEFADP